MFGNPVGIKGCILELVHDTFKYMRNSGCKFCFRRAGHQINLRFWITRNLFDRRGCITTIQNRGILSINHDYSNFIGFLHPKDPIMVD